MRKHERLWNFSWMEDIATIIAHIYRKKSDMKNVSLYHILHAVILYSSVLFPFGNKCKKAA